VLDHLIHGNSGHGVGSGVGSGRGS
jgi:hypothetical protein